MGKLENIQPVKKQKSLFGAIIKYFISLSLMVVIGGAAGLFYVYQKEKGKNPDLTDPEVRQWAKEKILGVVTTVSSRVLNTREDIEKWLKARNEQIPDTQDLLKRALDYLEKPAPAPKGGKTASTGRPSVPLPNTAVTASTAPETAGAEPVTEAVVEVIKTEPAPTRTPEPAAAAVMEKAPEPVAAKTFPSCPIDDPNCNPGTKIAATETPAVKEPETVVKVSDAVPLTKEEGAIETKQVLAMRTEPVVEVVEEEEAVEEEVEEKPTGREASPDYREAQARFRKGLEQYRNSTPGTPDEQKYIAVAEKDFRAAQEAAGRYLDAHPKDTEAEEFFVDINRFLYDCMKRKTLDVR